VKVCVVGLGYIGLPTAVLLAQENEVVGYDIDLEIVTSLQNGRLPFGEPGLNELFDKVGERFRPSTEIVKSDVYLICVPTPIDEKSRVADLSHLRSALKSISPFLERGNLVIIESTIPPGISERLAIPILERTGIKAGDFHYAYCPERAIPGKTLEEMINNDRVIGAMDDVSGELAANLYGSFVKGDLLITRHRIAEFVKLMENTYRDVNIALANEFAEIAEASGVNVWEAIELANRHPRVDILRPGPGVGGHCIAVDPWFLTENSAISRMISLARDINDTMPNYVMQLIRELMKNGREMTITILGVAYKANVDDTRETPARKLIRLAENEGYKVKVHDPLVKSFEYDLLTLDEAVKDTDCMVLITDHQIFREIDPSNLIGLVRSPNILDCRNLLDEHAWRKAGFNFKALGIGH
jgi:UDP-N-acetyl-D-mannosaminuronic acid dehydrogenase